MAIPANVLVRDVTERLKDVAHELHLTRISGAFYGETHDTWTIIEVRESSSLWDESRDGWEVTVERGGL